MFDIPNAESPIIMYGSGSVVLGSGFGGGNIISSLIIFVNKVLSLKIVESESVPHAHTSYMYIGKTIVGIAHGQ